MWYPAFSLGLTNVGSPVSTYKAIVYAPTGLQIEVTPNVLSFESLGQKKFFYVGVIAKMGRSIISGSLIWFDEVNQAQVRSPVFAHVFS